MCRVFHISTCLLSFCASERYCGFGLDGTTKAKPRGVVAAPKQHRTTKAASCEKQRSLLTADHLRDHKCGLGVRGGSNHIVPVTSYQSKTGLLLWKIPLIAAIVSFSTFGYVSRLFLLIVQWASHNTWVPSTSEQVNLQANIITQVVNGPVITSISVLFATLVSTTIATLQSRQVEIQHSLIQEVHCLRQLRDLLESDSTKETIHSSTALLDSSRQEALRCIDQHTQRLLSDQATIGCNTDDGKYENPHTYVESSIQYLLVDWCMRDHTIPDHQKKKKKPGPLLRNYSSSKVVAQVFDLSSRIVQERSHRWMAWKAVPFPIVHYLTLGLLAVSISVSFLVATAQAGFLFERRNEGGGLAARILWSVLITSFTALGVVCFDLARPFGGAYHVTRAYAY